MKYPIAIGICHNSHFSGDIDVNVFLNPFSDSKDKKDFYLALQAEEFSSYSTEDELICCFDTNSYRISPLLVGDLNNQLALEAFLRSQMPAAHVIFYFGNDRTEILGESRLSQDYVSHDLYWVSIEDETEVVFTKHACHSSEASSKEGDFLSLDIPKGSQRDILTQIFLKTKSTLYYPQSDDRYKYIIFHREQIGNPSSLGSTPLKASYRNSKAVNEDEHMPSGFRLFPSEVIKDISRENYFLPSDEAKTRFFENICPIKGETFMQGDFTGASDCAGVILPLKVSTVETESVQNICRIAYLCDDGVNGGVDIQYDCDTNNLLCLTIVKYEPHATSYNQAIITMIIPESTIVENEHGELAPFYKTCFQEHAPQRSYSQQEIYSNIRGAINNQEIYKHVCRKMKYPFYPVDITKQYSDAEISSFLIPDETAVTFNVKPSASTRVDQAFFAPKDSANRKNNKCTEEIIEDADGSDPSICLMDRVERRTLYSSKP